MGSLAPAFENLCIINGFKTLQTLLHAKYFWQRLDFTLSLCKNYKNNYLFKQFFAAYICCIPSKVINTHKPDVDFLKEFSCGIH